MQLQPSRLRVQDCQHGECCLAGRLSELEFCRGVATSASSNFFLFPSRLMGAACTFHAVGAYLPARNSITVSLARSKAVRFQKLSAPPLGLDSVVKKPLPTNFRLEFIRIAGNFFTIGSLSAMHSSHQEHYTHENHRGLQYSNAQCSSRTVVVCAALVDTSMSDVT